jgi:dTDP-4-dehydrorhamnose reductase
MAGMTAFIARRPVYTVLSTVKYREVTGKSPRSWREAVADYIESFHRKK